MISQQCSDEELRENYAQLHQRMFENQLRDAVRAKDKNLVMLSERGRRAEHRPDFSHLKSRIYTSTFGDASYVEKMRRVSSEINQTQKAITKLRKERTDSILKHRRPGSSRLSSYNRRKSSDNVSTLSNLHIQAPSSELIPFRTRPSSCRRRRPTCSASLQDPNCEALRRIAATGTSNAVNELAEVINELGDDDLNTSLQELDAYQKGLELAARRGCRPLSAPAIHHRSSSLNK